MATEQSGIGDPQATAPHTGRRSLDRVRKFIVSLGIKVAVEEDAGAKYATLVSPYAIDHMGYNQHGFFVRNDPRPGNEKGGVSYLKKCYQED